MGNFIGGAFFIPYMIFTLRGTFTKKMHFRLLSLLALGGTQGLIGWWMVKSGLNKKEDY